MLTKLEDAQDTILGKIDQICGRFGLNNIMAQLYGVLYLNDGPMSLNDMVSRLKISKGSASTNIRALERYGVVRKVWVKGSRKDYYEAEEDIARVIAERIRSMARNRLTDVDDMINASYKAINLLESSGKEDSRAISIFKQKVDRLNGLHAKAKRLFGLFDSFLSNGDLLDSGVKQEEKATLAV